MNFFLNQNNEGKYFAGKVFVSSFHWKVENNSIKLREEKLELESSSLKRFKVEKASQNLLHFLGSQAPTNHSTDFI